MAASPIRIRRRTIAAVISTIGCSISAQTWWDNRFDPLVDSIDPSHRLAYQGPFGFGAAIDGRALFIGRARCDFCGRRTNEHAPTCKAYMYKFNWDAPRPEDFHFAIGGLHGMRRHLYGREYHLIVIPLWTITLLLAVYPSMVLLWILIRRLRRGHCPHCSYNLTGNVSGVCPECGTAIRTPSAGAGPKESR